MWPVRETMDYSKKIWSFDNDTLDLYSSAVQLSNATHRTRWRAGGKRSAHCGNYEHHRYHGSQDHSAHGDGTQQKLPLRPRSRHQRHTETSSRIQHNWPPARRPSK